MVDVTAISIAYWPREEHVKLVARGINMMTYEEWLVNVQRLTERLQDRGHRVYLVALTVADLEEYCKRNHLEMNSASAALLAADTLAVALQEGGNDARPH